ncbi:PREDICTED: LOW QUALITY PROTEIN: BCL2/adenovirus E1B 19 kDa protein-interacting protein 3-like [Ceratotherium simum simum]|uniref:LOW QUALITY PROTEIN: BCL2/adenovirus E1B 19 kDa protein-interacting protein 3-like n=1 Tax=Ceratotherium simum simum TaxID=73337 RepID=A0ABM1CBT0_CERSS|nr:PREDICTED: LOW QUALITY PROTEIN: BCL2/adenovirus E1B 19 kDa protein-interacting protein 3-like [Ceratotherium simum simum]
MEKQRLDPRHYYSRVLALTIRHSCLNYLNKIWYLAVEDQDDSTEYKEEVDTTFPNGSTRRIIWKKQWLTSVSIFNDEMEKILLDAQHESRWSSSKSSHCDSLSQSPQDTNRVSETDTHSIGEKNSSQSEEDYMERRKEVESILKKNSDWIWDWSSRPENIPHKEFLFRHPKRTTTLSMRNTSVMKKGGIFSAEFLKVFLLSLLLSHLLAIGLGIYIGRHLTISTSTF